MIRTNSTSPSKSASALAAREAIFPRTFTLARSSEAPDAYLRDPAVQKLVEFFENKGLHTLKEEDRSEQWYRDWLTWQAEHRLYASVLSPKAYSTLGVEFDLLRYSRFLEVFAYFSPAHGYSLQVTFLGLFSILIGSNSQLKKEAVATLEAGGLLAFGISEKHHGADLMGNEFAIRATSPGHFVANGAKYYIGNANCAAIISILARKEQPHSDGRAKRAPPVLFALRPERSKGFRNLRKIRTLGVCSAFVGEFEVKDHELPHSDLIAEGRDALDAVFGSVTLGKFFLGFGSIGICEHAFAEAAAHLRGRILFGKPVIDMPHIRLLMAQAYARLTAMKLYAYRALDYVHAASESDRRYLLFCAVQKARVSIEGIRVMALLSECVGAKGFEADTYFEMALRDAQLFPGLESSSHINLGLTAQFTARYFGQPDPNLSPPKSLFGGEQVSRENPYLMDAGTRAINSVGFGQFLEAYRPWLSIANVRLFARQAIAFRLYARARRAKAGAAADTRISLAVGNCLATIAYGQLVAENARCLDVGDEMVSAIFHLLVSDLSTSALALASLPRLGGVGRILIRRLLTVPRTTVADWDFVSAGLERH